MIFTGDVCDTDFSGFARFFYHSGFNRTAIYGFHDGLVARIDVLGESGATLTDAYAEAFMDLVNRKIAFA